jgi:hypothetical protein
MHQENNSILNMSRLQKKINFVNSLGIDGIYDNVARYDI